MSVAGYDSGIPDMSTIESTFSMFHLPVMSIPLRSTREVLAMAGMDGGTSYGKLVAGFTTSDASYSIPPLLLPGLPGITVRVLDKKNKEEVVTAVRSAREKMTVRTGARGVPVLCNIYDDAMWSWVREGLMSATIEGGTMDKSERVIKYTRGGDSVGEEEVSGWLAGHDKGEEERDLITDRYCSRGWEAMGVLVISIGGVDSNLVMRGRTCVALVTDKKE